MVLEKESLLRGNRLPKNNGASKPTQKPKELEAVLKPRSILNPANSCGAGAPRKSSRSRWAANIEAHCHSRDRRSVVQYREVHSERRLHQSPLFGIAVMGTGRLIWLLYEPGLKEGFPLI